MARDEKKWYAIFDAKDEDNKPYYGIHIEAYSSDQARLKIKNFLLQRDFQEAAKMIYHYNMKVRQVFGPAPKVYWAAFQYGTPEGTPPLSGIYVKTNNLADAILMLRKRGIVGIPSEFFGVLMVKNPPEWALKEEDVQVGQLFPVTA